MRMLYLVGEPGVGKTTLMRALTSTVRDATLMEPVPHRALFLPGRTPHAAEIGIRRGQGARSFNGTDALSMSIQPKVLAWLEQSPYPLLVAEGDRLGNGKFFAAVQAMGVELQVLHLWVPQETLQARRETRGGRQDAKWVQGRATKVANLVGAYSAFPLQATTSAMVLAEHLAALPGPVGRMVRELRNGPDSTRRQEMLVVPEPGGDSAPAGLSADEHGSAADADGGTPQPDEESTATAPIAPPDGPGSAGGD